MSPAALTPRVRSLIVCDGVTPSRREPGVFSFKRVRWQVVADAFPFWRQLHLFVLLSSPRQGSFPGCVKVIDLQNDQPVFYGDIQPPPTFPEGGELLPVTMPANVRFPHPGAYVVQVCFFREDTPEVIKMEAPFFVLDREGHRDE